MFCKTQPMDPSRVTIEASPLEFAAELNRLIAAGCGSAGVCVTIGNKVIEIRPPKQGGGSVAALFEILPQKRKAGNAKINESYFNRLYQVRGPAQARGLLISVTHGVAPQAGVARTLLRGETSILQ
jgi:hypothetical protein